MNRRIYNKMRMYRQVIQIIQEHQPVWENHLPFEAAFTELQAQVVGLKNKAVLQLALKKNHSDTKKANRERLVAESFRIHNILSAFAEGSENTGLKHEIVLSASKWLRFSEGKFMDHVGRTVQLLNENLAGLAPYGIDQGVIDDYDELRLAYTETVTTPRNASIHLAACTAEIKGRIILADHVLNKQLAAMVRAFDQEEFTENFFKARKVIDYGSRPKGTELEMAIQQAAGDLIDKGELNKLKDDESKVA